MDAPLVTAIFLVTFDQRIGYTVAWSRSLPDISLDSVEYKSLPSGLHAVREDLIYFRHAHLSGVSAFVRGDADAEHRNAKFAAVGVLVSLSGAGSLGRAWEHAQELRDLARRNVGSSADTAALEAFWERHRGASTAAGIENSGKKRNSGGSEPTTPSFDLHAAWPKEHPALAVPEVMDLFGPLLLPLQRALLTRKRVLFLGSAPVRPNALVVWLMGVIGNVSLELGGAFPSEGQDLLRTQQFFNVGIHDMASLPGKEEGGGWLACTTDAILAEKQDLWDVLVRLPPQETTTRTWPTIHTADGRLIKASQRDARRWNLLRREMRRVRFQIYRRCAGETTNTANKHDEIPLLERSNASDHSTHFHDEHGRSAGKAVEAPTWTAVAYHGFMWWASAGEANAWEEDEAKADEELLFDLPDMDALSPTIYRKASGGRDAEYARAAATVVVAYFRRVTERIFRTLTSIIEEADDGTEEGRQDGDIEIRGSDLREMGLDSWSENDRTFFVRDVMEKWYGRTVVVVDEGLTLCGVRIC